MKKTTLKIQWDTLQAVNKLALNLSLEKKQKITQDQAIRYLLEKNKKEGENE